MIDSQTHPRWADSQRNFSEHLRSVRTLNTCLTNLLKVTFHRWFSMVVCFFRPLPGVFTHWDQIPWEAEEWWPGLRTHHRPIHSKPPLKFHELIPPPKKKHPPSEKSRRYKKKIHLAHHFWYMSSGWPRWPQRFFASQKGEGWNLWHRKSPKFPDQNWSTLVDFPWLS